MEPLPSPLGLAIPLAMTAAGAADAVVWFWLMAFSFWPVRAVG